MDAPLAVPPLAGLIAIALFFDFLHGLIHAASRKRAAGRSGTGSLRAADIRLSRIASCQTTS